MGSKSLKPPAIAFVVLLSLCYFLSNAQGTPFIHVADTTKGKDTPSCWTGGKESPCSSLSYALEGVHKTSNMTYHPAIFLEYITHKHELNATSFSTFNGSSNPNISNINIVGSTNCTASKTLPCALVECTGNSTGLVFIHVSNVTIQHVFFAKGCGAVHSSTSLSLFPTVDSYAKFRAALYFAYCKNILLQQVTILKSPGTGVAVYASTGYNVFQDCNFDSNSAVLSDDYPGGGGVYLEFPYCSPPMEDDLCDNNVPAEYVSNASYLFQGCSFSRNKASVTNPASDTFRSPQGKNHMAFGRGGGLSVFFKGRAFNNTIIVNGSGFFENSALWGGGIFAEFQDNSTNNSFHVYNSTVELNVCPYHLRGKNGTGGGGVRIGFIFFGNSFVKNNSILFDNCTFSNNTAYFGGGLSYLTARELDTVHATNTLEIFNCIWFGNRAVFGAAIHLSLFHSTGMGSIAHVKLSNITVAHHNSSSNLQTTGSVVGLGAVYIDTISTQFDLYINFHNNDNSALAAVESQIEIVGTCTADFTNNHGRNGGAVALFGSAYIRVHENTRMNFTHNGAELQGGAIYTQSVRGHDMLSSQNCFIRYKDYVKTPTTWQAYFNFTGNTAGGHNNSIYTTTVLPCMSGVANGSLSAAIDKVFCWSNWSYSSNCSGEIQTEPAEFSRSSYTMEVFPGRSKKLPVVTTDDLKNTATHRTVFTAESLDKSTAILDSSSRYISDSKVTLYGIPGKFTEIGLYSLDPRVLYVTINVTLNPCPPGYTTNDATSIDKTECTCPTDSYNGFVRCSRVHFEAYLQRQGQWIGRCGEACDHEDKEVLVAGYSRYTYNLNDTQLKLPHFASNLSEQLCGPSNRQGTACGMCIKGHAPSFDSQDFHCVKCSSSDVKYHWIFFLLTEMFPQTVLFAILVLFNVSLTSGPANAFLLFAQVITTSFDVHITRIAPYRTIWKSVEFVYDIANLDFFDALIPSYCLSPDMGTATLIALSYLNAVYPLFLIGLFFLVSQLYYRGERYRCVYYICRPIALGYAKLRRKYGLRPVGSIDALAAFLLLSYTKFTRVSIRLLSPTLLYDCNGKHKATVMFFDGTIGFFGVKHIPYILSAVIVIVLFLAPPPLLLIVYPIRKFRVFIKKHTCGKKEEDGRCVVEIKHFLDSFYGCYKDGRIDNDNKTRDMRSFAGVYFLCRIVFSVLNSINMKWAIQYSLQQILCTGIVLLILLVRPYKKELYNYVDGTIFSILAVINSLSSYSFSTDAYEQRRPSPAIFLVEYILVWLPLAYMIGYLVQYYCRKKKKASTSRMSQCAAEIEDDHISDNSIMCLVDERAQHQGEAETTGLSRSHRHSGLPPPSSSSRYGSMGSTKPSGATYGATP